MTTIETQETQEMQPSQHDKVQNEIIAKDKALRATRQEAKLKISKLR